MSTDLVRYDLLVQEALKSVVRKVLSDAASDGLPGDHHFYISFRTEHPGVRLSPRLREKYPQDMTVVLQHQFEQLTVNDSAFEVGLSFSGVAERLRVPFEALTGFFDPSVQFGLKFETSEDGAAAETEAEVTPLPLAKPAPAALKGSVPKIVASKAKKDGDAKPSRKTAPADKASASSEKAADSEKAAEAGAEIVSLDAFRKKS